jgi:ABC-type multidrug transport system ATPase subunit
MAASASSTWASRSRRSRGCSCWTSRSRGLAAAERLRIGDLIKRISADVPVLLVEHDIDRVFEIADAVTVMNDGRVLVDGSVEDARSSPKVQEVYIGSGAAAVAAKPRDSAAEPETLLALRA